MRGTGTAAVAWSLEKFPSLLAFNVYFFYFCKFIFSLFRFVYLL